MRPRFGARVRDFRFGLVLRDKARFGVETQVSGFELSFRVRDRVGGV